MLLDFTAEVWRKLGYAWQNWLVQASTLWFFHIPKNVMEEPIAMLRTLMGMVESASNSRMEEEKWGERAILIQGSSVPNFDLPRPLTCSFQEVV